MKNILLVLTAVLLFSSSGCMKKNVMKDIADDVNEAVISKSNGESFLVCKEEVFQATSKSDKGGIRQITGYTEYRISSYDLNTGKLSKRIELGDSRDNACIFLGETAGKLWYKSVDPELGFHARDPKNLEVTISQEKVTEVNPFLKNNLSQPEWNNINRYYGFDINKNKPMVSDNSGYLYYIDPVTLAAEKTSESIENFDFDNSCTSTSMKIDANSSINLSGSPRSGINLYSREIKEPSFLKGEFLKSSNRLTPADANPEFYAPFKKEIEKYQNEIDSLKKLIEQTDTSSSDKSKNYASSRDSRYAERNIENAKNRIKYAENNIKRYSDDEFFDLITNDKSVFILSQTDVTDKAKDIITKIRINSDTTVTQMWQTELKDFYRDPDKGFDKSSFEVVFSKGDPNLRTMRVVMSGEKLIFISMLKAACLDMNSGNILWVIDL